MDISDGLATDLPRLCKASGTGAEVNPTAIIRHPAIQNHPGCRNLQLSAGDDYQLLFSLRPEALGAVQNLANEHDIVLSNIGHLTSHQNTAHLNDGPWPEPLFEHFPQENTHV
jgi:thiamine-monophosphate kinase